MKKTEESIGIVDICFLIWKGRERKRKSVSHYLCQHSSLFHPLHLSHYLVFNFSSTPLH